MMATEAPPPAVVYAEAGSAPPGSKVGPFPSRKRRIGAKENPRERTRSSLTLIALGLVLYLVFVVDQPKTSV